MPPFTKYFYFNLRRDHHNISYEHRDYESVDEKSLSWLYPKKKREKIQEVKGLRK